jgi:hypothetical protein
MGANASHQRQSSCPRVAHVVLGNPFVHNTNHPSTPHLNGPLPARATLRTHLWLLATLRADIAAVLVVLPNDPKKAEVPGYRNLTTYAELPVEIIQVPNNTLGSYGMYLHAFATTRGRFDYYIFCEDDYVPVRADFVTELVALHERTFEPSAPAVLAGILQGAPVEAQSKYAIHLETSHIMSAASLNHVFHHTYEIVRWNGSTTDRMVHLARLSKKATNSYYFGLIQEGFGRFLQDAGVQMRDWTTAYRSPYWNHKRVLDYTGATSNFTVPAVTMHGDKAASALFLPMHYFVAQHVTGCCGAVSARCQSVRTRAAQFCLQPDASDVDCCAAAPSGKMTLDALRTRARFSASVGLRTSDSIWSACLATRRAASDHWPLSRIAAVMREELMREGLAILGA